LPGIKKVVNNIISLKRIEKNSVAESVAFE
jgi:hypothetical protein